MLRRVSLLVGLDIFSTLTSYFRTAIELIIRQTVNWTACLLDAGLTVTLEGYSIEILCCQWLQLTSFVTTCLARVGLVMIPESTLRSQHMLL